MIHNPRTVSIAMLSYSVWIARATRAAEALPFTLRTVKLIDDRLANSSYGFLLITGLAMVFTVPYPITTPWIISALILYAALVLLGLLGYTPTLRRQIALAESDGESSEAYQAMAKRGTTLGIALGVVTLATVFLMVVKPPLWG